jgi:hypothetical protein
VEHGLSSTQRSTLTIWSYMRIGNAGMLLTKLSINERFFSSIKISGQTGIKSVMKDMALSILFWFVASCVFLVHIPQVEAIRIARHSWYWIEFAAIHIKSCTSLLHFLKVNAFRPYTGSMDMVSCFYWPDHQRLFGHVSPKPPKRMNQCV